MKIADVRGKGARIFCLRATGTGACIVEHAGDYGEREFKVLDYIDAL